MKGYLPASGAHPSLALADSPGGGHQDGESQVGGGLGQYPRSVAHENAPAGGGIHVDVVQSHGHLADNPELGGAVEQVGVHPVHDVGHHAFRVGYVFGKRLRCRGRFMRPDFHLRGLANEFQRFRENLPGHEHPRTVH